MVKELLEVQYMDKEFSRDKDTPKNMVNNEEQKKTLSVKFEDGNIVSIELGGMETKTLSASSVRILREAKEELDLFDSILNRVIKSKNHLTIEKTIQRNHEEKYKVYSGIGNGNNGPDDNDEWWVVSFLFPECLSEDSMGTSIIKNIEKFNKMLSPRYFLYVVGLDNNNDFDDELFNFMCDHFSKISNFEWDGETTLLTVRYRYIFDGKSMMNRVELDFNKVCIHLMDSLVKDGTYTNYKKIILEMNNIIKRSKTAKDVFRELDIIKIKAQGKIIIKSLFNAIKEGAWAKVKSLIFFIK